MFKKEDSGISNIEMKQLDDEELLSASYSDNTLIYPMTNIKVEKGFYTVFELKRKYDSEQKKIVLDSSFQREDVWTSKQKSELIESILMGLPLPIFYFNEDRKGRLLVVDGRQRLTALFEFLDGEWALSNKLRVLIILRGKKFKDLEPIMQSKIEDYQIHAHVIQPPTPDRLKFDIFDRVNRAGTQLNKQEIRNALYQGNATKLLNNITELEEFSKATGQAFKKNSRMKDKYIVLRFLSLLLYFSNELRDDDGNNYVYKNDMDEMLGKCMEYFNNASEVEIDDYFKVSKGALSKVYICLGGDAFRLITGEKRSPINMNLFECLMYLMSKLDAYDQRILDKIKYKIMDLKNNDDFLDSIGNHRDSLQKINKRINMMNAILEEM